MKAEDLYERQRQQLRAKHGNRWTRAAAIEGILCFYTEFGRAPTAAEWKQAGPWPSFNTVTRLFGSWAAAIEAAGLPRPGRGIWVRASRNQPRGRYVKASA